MLAVHGLTKHFGGVRALDGVDFTVQPGECVALIGPNGAGKSTCFACIAGQHAPTAGSVAWLGASIDGLPPAARLARGVARTFQVAQTFEALTVRESIQLLLVAPLLRTGDRLGQRAASEADALLERCGIAGLGDRIAAGLPYGAKKRLELAMALASKPTLLLLDEPAAGLASEERAMLMRLVRQLATDGLAVLYTEHNMDAVFGVADRVLVLIDGQLAADGTPEAVAADPTVQRRYLGVPAHA